MAGFLTVEEKKGLEEALRVERYARYSDRIKCILLLDAGDPPEEIAHFLFLSLSTITNYMRRYYDGGLTGLIQDRYMGSECRLSEDELVEFVQHLEDNLYLTISAIRDYVLSKYQVLYTVSGLRHLLNRLGFVYKKPKAIPGKASRDLQAEFLSILDERLQENSDSIAVFFADGTHPQHNTHCAYGWIKKGVRIELMFLPPYSPNLNIIERLWRLLKKEVLYNRYIEKFSDFRKVILEFFENIKDYSSQLESLMTLKFHLVGS